MAFSFLSLFTTLLLSTFLTSTINALDLRNGGTYIITNVKSGAALDLSAFDNTTVIGWPLHGAANQRWTLQWQTRGWAIQNERTQTHLHIDSSPGSPRDGTLLVAGTPPTPDTRPMEWHIWADGPEETGVFRVYIPNTILNWDLFGNGDATPGTAVQVWTRWGGVHQTWKFVPA